MDAQNTLNLRRMRILINRYPRACFNVERAKSRAQRATQQLTGMPSGGAGSTIADGVEMIMQAEEARDRIAAELARMRALLAPVLDQIADPLRKTALRMRYMDGNSAREIAYQLCYSESRIFKSLKDGEREIERLLP